MRSRKEQIDSNKLIGSGTALERRGCRPGGVWGEQLGQNFECIGR